MKFFHAADIHLDSPLRGLDRYDGAPVDKLRGATRRALENLVAQCIDERVEFLLIAGDLYDGDWTDYNTGLFFAKQMSRLREAGIRVFIVRGNHDARSKILRLPEGVRELSAKKPETILLDDLGVAVHGRSYEKADTTEDLSVAYPAPREGYFNVGLLHTCASGREGHQSYAPCSVSDLVARRYDYWALGHVHAREVLHESPWIVFPGNLQGRHARETGKKGATLVTVDEGRIVGVEPRTLDALRWVRCEVDARMASSVDDVIELCREALAREADAAEERIVAARIEVTGATRAHGALSREPEKYRSEVRSAASDAGEIWVEKISFRTRNPLDAEASLGDEAVGGLYRQLRAICEDDAEIDRLLSGLDPLRKKLPAELDHLEGGGKLDRTALRQLVRELPDTLLPLLFAGEDAS